MAEERAEIQAVDLVCGAGGVTYVLEQALTLLREDVMTGENDSTSGLH